MARIVIPPHPGVLSALGLAAASERVDVVASIHERIERLDGAALRRAFEPLVAAGTAALPATNTRVAQLADCRFAGQGYEVTVPVPGNGHDTEALAAAFRSSHQARHGHADPAQPIELVNVRVVVERPVPAPRFNRARPGSPLKPERREIMTRQGHTVQADVWPLDALPVGQVLVGPAVLAGRDATALIEPGWRGVVHDSGAVIVERA
jgi:N-methylhydantoinase A/oxoprolinase/acetone carboxylase beta subunit